MNHSDPAGARLGMWLFLFTEIMFFSGLFVLFAAYYYNHTDDFIRGSSELNVIIGTANTAVLLISSFFVASAVRAVERKSKISSIIMLGVSLSLGIVFLVNKYFEWSYKAGQGIYPGSDTLLEMPKGTIAFYNLYYFLTGLHAIHVIVGLVLLTVCLVIAIRVADNGKQLVLTDNVGLYWHLVDIIWIFLFPLFYLLS
ncbi:MAG: cytochrome C oxidase subunit III [Candidatus Melainabacteria bacterium HGW-Melainabacteria-1]|nr:MAG: cytochrome C oxidase subunit III [Candidatus Melainabacteria bacterium HGW-Melainabacteria-1]